MQLTPAIYRNSIYYFIVFAMIVFAGFWVYYVDPIGRRGSQVLVHVHAITMTVWCLLLITQAVLIRSNQRQFHRLIGRTSVLIVPIIVILQLVIVPGFIERQGGLDAAGVTDGGAFALSYILGNAAVFAILYLLAIANRRVPAIHARYMICTALPILGPATDRIIFRDNPWIQQYLPTKPGIGGPWESVVAFAIADIVVFSLAIWDWRSHRRLNVFPIVLLLLLAYQVFNPFSYRVPLWRDFCNWFMGV